jgi:hypothetical protein
MAQHVLIEMLRIVPQSSRPKLKHTGSRLSAPNNGYTKLRSISPARELRV